MRIATTVGTRATCDRAHVGCVAVRDKCILSTGYNGSPIGLSHCDDVGHEIHTVTEADGSVSEHCIRTTHAEQNTIAQAARRGVSLDGGTLYCTMTPCYTCAKIIINAGITRVVYKDEYPVGERTRAVFKEAGVELRAVSSGVDYKGE